MDQCDTNCPLCRLIGGNVYTHQYYDDTVVKIVDCDGCNVPMMVIKRHDSEPNGFEKGYIENLAAVMFPGEKFRGPNSIPEHWHLHQTY